MKMKFFELQSSPFLIPHVFPISLFLILTTPETWPRITNLPWPQPSQPPHPIASHFNNDSNWDIPISYIFIEKEGKWMFQFSSVASLSHVRLFATPWTAACQASLSITSSRSLPKRMSFESVMPSNHLILCRPLLLPPSIFPSIRVFSNESALHIRWPKYWSCSFSISPFNEYSGLISFRMDWLDLHAL